MTKLKAYADNKLKVAKLTIFLFDRAENTGKRRKCCLTLSQTSPGFYVSAVQSFWKQLWEKEELLVTNNFSFTRSVFYPSEALSATFIRFEIVIWKPFQFGKVWNLLFWKGLTAFSPFPTVFPKSYSLRLIIVGIVWSRVKHLTFSFLSV